MRLASADLGAAADTLLYTVPADNKAIVSLTLCNRGGASPKVRVALTNGAAPTAADWIEYDTPLPIAGSTGGSSLQLTGIALGAAQRIYVRSDLATVGATVHGVVQSAV